MQSDPYLSILAFPRGRTNSGSIYSAFKSNSMLYIISFSRNMTGSLDLIEALIRPMLSSALHGDTVINPGQDPYHAAKH